MAYKNNVKYRIDLSTVFNRTYSNREIKRSLYPLLSDPSIKRAYGLAVIDEIINRTQDKRIDKKNAPLATYSKSYAKSLAGQVYGKRAGVRANLTLSGEMLSSMDVHNERSTSLYIMFVDETNAAKAHGHIHGIKRNDYAGKKVVRDFFGLPKDKEEQILKELIGGRRREEMLLNLDVNALTTTQTINEPGQNIGIGFEEE